MIPGPEGDAELANAAIAHRQRNLKHGLISGAQQLRRPGHAALQDVLVDGSAVKLPEAGLQKGP